MAYPFPANAGFGPPGAVASPYLCMCVCDFNGGRSAVKKCVCVCVRTHATSLEFGNAVKCV